MFVFAPTLNATSEKKKETKIVHKFEANYLVLKSLYDHSKTKRNGLNLHPSNTFSNTLNVI